MIVSCLTCKTEFNTKPCHIKSGGGKFCSTKCYGVSLLGKPNNNKGKKYPERSGINHPNHVKRVKTSCPVCFVVFEALACNNKQFCTRECSLIAAKTRLIGDKNPAWEGGKTKIARLVRELSNYKEWRINAIKRDKYTCLDCGQVGGKLEVDHIFPFSLLLLKYKITDSETAMKCTDLWELSNAKTLCKECHRNTKTYGIIAKYQPQFQMV